MARKIGFLGLVNYKDHPTNKNYRVFNFNSIEEAELFESILINKKIKFEKDDTDSVFLFAVEQNQFEKALNANFEVYAKFNKPYIKNKKVKMLILFLFFSIVTFALIGHIISNN